MIHYVWMVTVCEETSCLKRKLLDAARWTKLMWSVAEKGLESQAWSRRCVMGSWLWGVLLALCWSCHSTAHCPLGWPCCSLSQGQGWGWMDRHPPGGAAARSWLQAALPSLLSLLLLCLLSRGAGSSSRLGIGMPRAKQLSFFPASGMRCFKRKVKTFPWESV